MIEQLRSNAELNAEKAENLRTFSGLKLLHIKKQVEKEPVVKEIKEEILEIMVFS